MKLDLHTHIWEATGCVAPPTREVVEKVIDLVRTRGLDGIAITDHHRKEYAFQFKELVDREFDGAIIVIPGQEIEVHTGPSPDIEARYGPDWYDEYQVCELFLPGHRVFRSYAHPGYPSEEIVIDGVQAIEISNTLHNWHINKDQVRRVAREHDLLLFSVSDAHNLRDIGASFTEIDLEEMYARSMPLEGTS